MLLNRNFIIFHYICVKISFALKTFSLLDFGVLNGLCVGYITSSIFVLFFNVVFQIKEHCICYVSVYEHLCDRENYVHLNCLP